MVTNTLKPGSYLTRKDETVTQGTVVAPIVWGIIGHEDAPVMSDTIIEVKSYADFKDKFGLTSEKEKTSALALAVYLFYLNNSGSVFILNVTDGGTKATDTDADAKAPGTWGNDVKISVTSDAVTIKYGDDTEVFAKDINEINANSKYITAKESLISSSNKEVTLTGGKLVDLSLDKDTLKAKLEMLVSEETITIVSLATSYDGLSDITLLPTAIKEIEEELDRKVLPIAGINYEKAQEIMEAKELPLAGFYRSTLYAPFVNVQNPFTNGLVLVNPELVLPSMYGKLISTYGTQQSPAGVEAVLPNTVSVEKAFTDREAGLLNSLNVNSITAKKKYGVVAWGNRLSDEDGDREYISDLLLDDYIDAWIKADTETFSFKNADTVMYSEISARISAFLRELWTKGALAGETTEEAYVVKCDKDTNVDAKKGEVYAEVGWAKKYPAEFIFTTVKYIAK